MTIPIRNLYYIFCYAWARFPGGDQVDVGEEECPDLPNLFAKLLLEASHRLMRRGLDRGYVQQTEETRSPKGRLLIDRIIKEQTARRGTAICGFDELQHDVLHNQILKATARTLASVDSVSPKFRHELSLFRRQLDAVSDIRLTSSSFRRVQLSRDRNLYGMLMRLCEFVFHSVLPEQSGTGARFADILDDEVRMSTVFEEFLRNFYDHEQSQFQVKRVGMTWQAEALVPGAMAYMPAMETDITLNSTHRTIVIDAKYYKQTLVSRPGFAQKLRTNHLYQLFTYLQHAKVQNPGKQVDGALIYPSVGLNLSLDYRIFGHRVRIVTVDLDREWLEIHRGLLDLITRSFEGSVSAGADREIA